MRKIAVINQKGGVGKTTTAVNLAAGIASCGHRVCLLDLDPQAHASLHLGVTLHQGEPSLYDVLCNEMALSEVRRDLSDHLSVLPSHLDLAAAEMELASEVGREVILRDRLEQDSAPFDFLILDCPPSLGVLTLNALTAVDEVILPMQPHFLALHGLSKLLRTIEIVSKRLNPTLRLEGIVLCRSQQRYRGIPQSQRVAKPSLGLGKILPNQNPTQYPPCRSPQFRSVNLRLRTDEQRRRGLPSPGSRCRRENDPCGPESQSSPSRRETTQLRSA